MKSTLRKLRNSAKGRAKSFAGNSLGIGLIDSFHMDDPYRDYKTNINIGAGGWSHPNWTCLDLPSEWYHKSGETKFRPFDILKDDIPYGDGEVDLIYCSQVIEHIPESAADKLFAEFARVLAPTGGIRLIGPDARLLYHMYKDAPAHYWSHQYEWTRGPLSTEHDLSKWTPADFVVRELATPRLRHYKHAIDPVQPEQLEGKSFEELIHFLLDGLQFRYDMPGDHINWWTFEKLAGKFEKVGLQPFRSGFGQSMFPPFKEVAFFDNSHYWTSFFVDAVHADGKGSAR